MSLDKVNLPDKFSNDVIENNFIIYNHFKGKSDYFFDYNKMKVPTSKFMAFDKLDDVEIVEKNDTSTVVYAENFIERLNPDLIDSKKFWKKAVEYFPLYSMSDSNVDISYMEDLKNVSNTSAKIFGILAEIDELFTKNNDAAVLEIGAGYGNVASYINENFNDENYYAIDVGYYFWHDRLFGCDGKSIPSDVPKGLDMVVASNVFQYLGTEQRKSYYSEIYKWLKPGGSFIFNMYLVSNSNKDKNCWQNIDKKGNFYCKFFNQLIKCDTTEELVKENSIKFNIDIINLLQMNIATIKFTKK